MKENLASILSPSAEFSGRLTFKSEVRIEGSFKGEILSEGKLIIGKDAVVEGQINVRELMVQGTLIGEAVVTKLTTLQKTARITANVSTALLIMEEGALLQGNLTMGANCAPDISMATDGNRPDSNDFIHTPLEQ